MSCPRLPFSKIFFAPLTLLTRAQLYDSYQGHVLFRLLTALLGEAGTCPLTHQFDKDL